MNQNKILWFLVTLAGLYWLARRNQTAPDPVKAGPLFGGTTNWLPWQPTPLDDKMDAFDRATAEYNALMSSTGAITARKVT